MFATYSNCGTKVGSVCAGAACQASTSQYERSAVPSKMCHWTEKKMQVRSYYESHDKILHFMAASCMLPRQIGQVLSNQSSVCATSC